MLNDILVVGSSFLNLSGEMILLDRDGSVRVAGVEKGSERIKSKGSGKRGV